MITSTYARTMAAYNAEMNRRLYAAAGRLSDAERRRDRGAFFGSIHGTLCHLVWGDLMWMSRFDGGAKPAAPIADSPNFIAAFDEIHDARQRLDLRIDAWAASLDEDWLTGDLTWFSGATGQQTTAPRALLVTHFFNHQTHHRGQTHAMLTAAGEATGATDLPWVVPQG